MIELTHCYHNQGFCLASGLFVSTSKKTVTAPSPVQIDYEVKARKYRITSPFQLNAADLRVLQGSLALFEFNKQQLLLLDALPISAGEKEKRSRSLAVRKVSASTASNQVEADLIAEMQISEELKDPKVFVTQGSCWRIATLVGYGRSGTSATNVVKSLSRLAQVKISLLKEEQDQLVAVSSFQLLSFHHESGEHVCIALSPLFTKALNAGGSRTIIQLDEVRALKSDPARILHQRLSAQIAPGQSRPVGVDKLIGYIWDDEVMSAALYSKRKHKLNQILQELRDVGWIVTDSGFLGVNRQFKRPSVAEKKAKFVALVSPQL